MTKLKDKIKNILGEKKTASLNKALKIGRTFKNVVCWIMIAVLTAAIVVFIVTKVNGGTPTVFGYSIHRIASGSMEPELMIGDVIVNKNVTDPSEVHIGDIITFQGDYRFDDRKVTHRVLVAPYDDGRGGVVLVTQGDANEVDDGDIDFADVESKYVMKVTFLSSIYDFFFSPWGLIVFIFLLLLIFLDEILNIIRLSVNSAEKDDPESIQDIIERIRLEKLEEEKRLLSAENPVQGATAEGPEKYHPAAETADTQDAAPEKDFVKTSLDKGILKNGTKKPVSKGKKNADQKSRSVKKQAKPSSGNKKKTVKKKSKKKKR